MAKYVIDLDDEELERNLINGKPIITGIFDDRIKSKTLTPYEEPEREKPMRWRAKKGELYWLVNSVGMMGNIVDRRYEEDNWRHQSGNYFRTKEEAEEYRESVIVYNELKAYAEPEDAEWKYGKRHWDITYDYGKNKVQINVAETYRRFGLYFASLEAAQAAIEAVGVDLVKRHYLGIKED